ncbi:hypothetical protein DTO96_101425 [Ephemeroptericola cinctiostellae]|uniref:Uncharacterized protein n=1 Tax=Ephemeroptericola cinctiostellae TaxID=2268024 RepID=A0A345DBF6_9BURK|nr:hypothetical protein DTO96_101425 [Ephemeroptericola cinctiostellae]
MIELWQTMDTSSRVIVVASLIITVVSLKGVLWFIFKQSKK